MDAFFYLFGGYFDLITDIDLWCIGYLKRNLNYFDLRFEK
jgi:hypothetical protein